MGGDAIEGPWDGEEAITLMADLDAGATGAMTGGAYPDGIRQIIDPYFAGDREEAAAAYERWLPLINYENRQCGLLAAKVLMKEGGVIRSEAVRHPLHAAAPGNAQGPDRGRAPCRPAGAALGAVSRRRIGVLLPRARKARGLFVSRRAAFGSRFAGGVLLSGRAGCRQRPRLPGTECHVGCFRP